MVVVPLAIVSACRQDDADDGSSAAATPPGIESVSETSVAPTEDDDPADDPRGDFGDELGVTPEGFRRVAATVEGPDGAVCELCLWLADDVELRSRGLMHVTDLRPGDGMAFVYPRPHTGTFWMKDTVLPLSIAFFAAGGDLLSSFDMTPCSVEPCGTYPTPTDFVIAVEVAQGDLAALGIVPGSTLSLSTDSCP